MPTGSEIVAQNGLIANAAVTLAIVWHAALLVIALGLALRWRPSQRHAARLVALLPASAAVTAAIFGNPFNALLLGALAIVLAIAAQGSSRAEPVKLAPLVAVLPGVLLLAAGVWYPEFLTLSPRWYLVAAPLGVLPCPTLYAAVGLALIFNLGGRLWGDALALVALFYGVTGVARLDVRFDLGLIAGALVLATLRFLYRPRSSSPGAPASPRAAS